GGAVAVRAAGAEAALVEGHPGEGGVAVGLAEADDVVGALQAPGPRHVVAGVAPGDLHHLPVGDDRGGRRDRFGGGRGGGRRGGRLGHVVAVVVVAAVGGQHHHGDEDEHCHHAQGDQGDGAQVRLGLLRTVRWGRGLLGEDPESLVLHALLTAVVRLLAVLSGVPVATRS